MKKLMFFARHAVLLFLALPLVALGQESDPSLNYVVIGAFAYRENAVTFTDDARQQKFPARFEMNRNRNLYYVYVLTTADHDLARAEAVRLRAETKYFDTWVYSGGFGPLHLATGTAPSGDIDPLTGIVIKSIPSVGREQAPDASQQKSGSEERRENESLAMSGGKREVARATSPLQRNPERNETSGGDRVGVASKGSTTTRAQTLDAAVDNEPAAAVRTRHAAADRSLNGDEIPVDQQSPADQEMTGAIRDGASAQNKNTFSATSDPDAMADRETEPPVSTTAAGDDNRVTSAVPIPPPTRVGNEPLQPADVVGKDFYFYLFRGDNGNTIRGEVDAIDFERSRKMATYPANESVTVHIPTSDSKRISFICQVFGYRKQQQEYDPAAPSEEFYLDDKGDVVVPFELVRLQKGDIAIMYNVMFFKDAAVMRPESRYEVNNLLELLQENPSYNIRIHGHTNGNAAGRIIRMDMPGNFYSLTGTKEGFGSAKKLSEERAEVIKGFLVHSGIAEDRMTIKAWGGKKPIHDPRSVRAIENVRVEIEILSE